MTNTSIQIIDVVTQSGSLYSELGRVLVEDLCQRGIDSRQLFSPDQIQRRPDVMLFICDFPLVETFEQPCRQWSTRPLTAWWFLEPLPPGNMPEAFLKTGRKMARCHWPDMLCDIFPPFKACFSKRQPGQKPKCKRITEPFQRGRAMPVIRHLKRQGYNTSNLDYRDIFWMMCRLDNIQKLSRSWPIDMLFSTALSRCQVLNQVGCHAQLLPIGYHPMWGEYLGHENRDIDVVFLGHIRKKKGKRGLIVRHVEKEMQSRGFKMKIIHDGCFGRQRTELLNRTKILLDAVRMPWELPGMRMLVGASCGTLNVSCGYAGDDAVYRPDEHFIDASLSKLADTIQYYLENEPERRKIADQARNFLARQNTFAVTVEEMLSVFQERLQNKQSLSE